MNILLFGANGSIGSYIHKRALEKGPVYPTSSSQQHFIHFNHKVNESYENLKTLPRFDVVIWAQGKNENDGIGFAQHYDSLMDVNVNFVVKSLDWLVSHDKLNEGARLCIISSIWQNISRKNKFSYSVSKAALGGVVRSAAADLQSKNIYLNAILPGPVDNQMTRQNLTKEQIQKLFNLVSLEDIWNAVDFMCFKNSCMNGQSLILDHGFSVIQNL
jgi:NAD(P)-dependent dehydrogenase (short-subunit alcohol dehydrogenase family)